MRKDALRFLTAIPLFAAGFHPALACAPAKTAGDVHFNAPFATPVSVRYGMRTHPLLGYLKLHTGWDYAGAIGTPVRAAAGGQVVAAGHEGAYGKLVVIDHGRGLQTAYAHLSQIDVAEGACVESGMRIGAVGVTGLSAGPHLHFEVRKDGEPIDPAHWLDRK